MLSNNLPTTFSVKKGDFLPISGRYESNFIAHLMHSLMKDRVTSLTDFHSDYKDISGANLY